VPGFLFQRTVNPSAELDVETLTQIAQLTGGIFQRARSSEELKSIYEALDELEPIEQDLETYRPVRSLFWYPLAFTLVMTLLFSLLHPTMTSWVTNLWASISFRKKQNEVAAP
jgi:Ca-activated chloride channel family protein